MFIASSDSTNVEDQKKAFKHVAFGHNDDAVTSDDFEHIIRPPLEVKTLPPPPETHTTTTENPTPNVTDNFPEVVTSEKLTVTSKPTPNPSGNYEDDFRDPYWN